MDKNEMVKKIRELKELKLMADELSNEITAIEDEIKAELVANNTEEMVVDIFKIKYTTVISNRLDTTAFKIKHMDLYKEYCKESFSKRFSIS